MIKKLTQTGLVSFSGIADDSSSCEKGALLVYEGTFQSMDGEVVVTSSQLDKLASLHNARCAALMAKNQAEGKEGLDPSDCPPVQVDHSVSGWDTVGRLVGMLEVKDYTTEAGKTVKALFGKVRILGKENVQKVLDGRWSNLSIGADFDSGTINELTITPFPAAAEASLLSKVKLYQEIRYKGATIYWTRYFDGEYEAYVHETYLPGQPMFKSRDRNDVVKRCKDAIDQYLKSRNQVSFSKLSQGEAMDKEKFKKHLMEVKKMSEEDADKHLAKCEADEEEQKKLAAEVDDEDKKLAAEDADKKKKEEEDKAEKDNKLAASKTDFIRLAKGMKKSFSTTNMESKKLSVMQRLSALRAKNRLTPAEQKKIDIVKLASKSEAEVEAFFSGFETREDIVPLGQLGSAKAEPVAKIASQRQRLASKVERLTNMPWTKRVLGSKFGLGDDSTAHPDKMTPEQMGSPVTQEEGHQARDVEHLDSRFSEVCRMLDEGKRDDALKHLKDWMSGVYSANDAGTQEGDGQHRMSALAEETKKLQNQFEELIALVGPALGVETKELAS